MCELWQNGGRKCRNTAADPLDGQFVFADGAGVTAAKLHLVDTGTSCDAHGTAAVAPSPT